MLLSRSLKMLVLGCGLLVPGVTLLAGCDRQGSEAAQGAKGGATAPAQAAQAQAAAPKGIDRSHKGSALPDMTFRDPAGHALPLASLKGQPVLINLWATWCAPCVKELPTLDAVAAQGQVRVVTISQDSAEPAKVAAFLKDKGLKRLEPWLDPDSNLAFHFQANTLPTSVLYDSAGREVWRFTGEQDWASAEAARLFSEAR